MSKAKKKIDSEIHGTVTACLARPGQEHDQDGEIHEIFHNQQQKDEERALAIDHFIEKNKNLIEKEAKKRFGDNYSKKEVYSEAVLAIAKACHNRNKKKRTKLTSLWWFYFQKQLDDLQTIKAYDSPFQKAPSGDGGEDENYDEWQMDQASMEMDAQDLLESCPDDQETDSHYTAAVKSFTTASTNNVSIPQRLIKAIAILANGAHYRKKINEVKGIYELADHDQLIAAMREDIAKIHATGHVIYRAECLANTPEQHSNYVSNKKNCRRSIVFACAPNEREAHTHLAEFGEVLTCKPYQPLP